MIGISQEKNILCNISLLSSKSLNLRCFVYALFKYEVWFRPRTDRSISSSRRSIAPSTGATGGLAAVEPGSNKETIHISFTGLVLRLTVYTKPARGILLLREDVSTYLHTHHINSPALSLPQHPCSTCCSKNRDNVGDGIKNGESEFYIQDQGCGPYPPKLKSLPTFFFFCRTELTHSFTLLHNINQ